jgi:lipid II isoglutaminyl synthase (glutamine-hydrolysing)
VSNAGGVPALPWSARLATRAAVAVGATSRRLGRGDGSVIGGRVGLLIDPRLLAHLAVGRKVALVSGTNGKTTTTRLLACAMGGLDHVATSSAGANLPGGLAAALASSVPGTTAVLEVDEGYLTTLSTITKPATVTLLNLSRDQLDRVSEVRMVAGWWRRALSTLDAATVVANVDDPLVTWAASEAKRRRWVAAGSLWRSDAVGCPVCDGAITFDAGDWWCECGFRRPEPDMALRGDELVTSDARRFPLELALPGRFNRANAAMAAATAEVLGVELGDAVAAMATLNDVEGRFAVVDYAGITTRLLLAKNPAGWAELLGLLESERDPVVIGINARVPDGHDPSWLWDVPFERLAPRPVVATGERCRDLAVRLRHAGVPHTTVEDQLDALREAGSARVEYVGNYTAFQDLRRRLARAGASATGVATTTVERTTVVKTTVATNGADTNGAAPRRRRKAAGSSTLSVVVVHPDLLGTYGDGGNGVVLAGRAGFRGMPVELVLAPSDSPLPMSADVYCLGGGEDGPQVRSAQLLSDSGFGAAVAAGAVVLAVCAGYQIVGQVFAGPDGRPYDGLGLLDIVTVKGSGPRAVGEVVADLVTGAEVADPVLVPRLTGFENHSGFTRLGPGAAPLATVRVGVGNGAGRTGAASEGARSGRVIGTYMHGPVLARNPALADMLLAMATGSVPEPLEDVEETALRAERLAGALGIPWGGSARAAGRAPLLRVRRR